MKLFRQEKKFEDRRIAAKLAKEMEVDKGSTNDMETWHFDKKGKMIDKGNMDEDRDPKGLGKGSSS